LPSVPQKTIVRSGEELFATVGAGVVDVGLGDAVAVAVGVGDARTVDTGTWLRTTYTRPTNRTVTSATTTTNAAFLTLEIAAR